MKNKDIEKMVAFPVMFVYFIIPNITVERYRIPYFVLQGVQTHHQK